MFIYVRRRSLDRRRDNPTLMGVCTKNDIGDKMIKFDKVFVITLESNPGRYKAFKKKLENIKFPQPHEKFYGIVENPPKWWRLSKGFLVGAMPYVLASLWVSM